MSWRGDSERHRKAALIGHHGRVRGRLKHLRKKLGGGSA